MASICKTIRLADDRMMRKFIEKQQNFSNAIRYLVIKYCQEMGYDNLQDLSVLYKNLTEYQIYQSTGSSSDVATEKKVFAVEPAPSPDIKPEKRRTLTNEPLRQAEESRQMTASAMSIPSCYQ